MKEKDMFEPVKNLLINELGCSDVYGEVSNFDVLGLMGPADVIVEMKMSLNFKVIEQALRAINTGHYIYIAVPRPKSRTHNHWFVYHQFLKPNGIGLIYVTENRVDKEDWERWKDEPYYPYLAEINKKAKFNHFPNKFKKKSQFSQYTDIRYQLEDWMKENVGGSKGGEIITPYSHMIDAVKAFLRNNGWSTIDEILENVPEVTNHYSNPKASLRATFNARWNQYWIEVKTADRKRYFRVKEGI